MKNEEVERLFRENYRRMFLVAVFLLHDEAEGKDVVHDVFETVMRNGIELRGETASGYLLSSTRNRCLNRLRSMRIKEKVANEYVIFSNLESVTDEDASEEKIATLNAGISLLQPPVRKKIIEMHFKQGLKFREIAAKLGISETAVYNHLRQAMASLRSQLTDNEYGKD
ncbi:MAG: sigma-70 family RNA polymerase sigma factor [Candidatus Cryptobacteroides sp.]|nr:sigma-70 family RNA polymerase sigma factor [Bacteroidales bacterium]MEE3390290.1 sigma-70 family RNA polymerase sigma factor [Candidatus Cryptobacteroides sp.]MEE3429958.1 sigma-70 family RNA polymerase sigma factor [Candidatus Cryptobacteroides sp.]